MLGSLQGSRDGVARHQGRKCAGWASIRLSDGRFMMLGIVRKWGIKYLALDENVAVKTRSEAMVPFPQLSRAA